MSRTDLDLDLRWSPRIPEKRKILSCLMSFLCWFAQNCCNLPPPPPAWDVQMLIYQDVWTLWEGTPYLPLVVMLFLSSHINPTHRETPPSELPSGDMSPQVPMGNGYLKEPPSHTKFCLALCNAWRCLPVMCTCHKALLISRGCLLMAHHQKTPHWLEQQPFPCQVSSIGKVIGQRFSCRWFESCSVQKIPVQRDGMADLEYPQAKTAGPQKW